MGRVPHTHQLLCIPRLLMIRAERIPNAPAILAPGRSPLTYNHLWQHVGRVVQTLHARELRRHARVALVLPNGPEMAVACLAVASGATCIPLNPAHTTDEFAFYLGGLHVQALLIQADIDSPARAVAHAHGLQIIELCPKHEAEAGLFTLAGMGALHPDVLAYTQPDDVAFVMHSSGTTSRPKSVPLTHTNTCTSAIHARVALGLAENDRYLNILPLFHVVGLISGLITSLMAGGSVVCTPDFAGRKFFDWLAEFRPTWYMGVSAIHQTVLSHAPFYREVIDHCPLRFIRAPATALSLKMHAELENTFNVPVLRSYGVTEATLISCNPLPPQQRKPDSVGVAVGPEIATMDFEGRLLPVGEIGEIVIRGPNVMRGYENNPAANREAFKHGWFRTGDQGFLDADGYLFITGRLKELINRGGENITPQEVDGVFMRHPVVAQAVTFGIPHARWEEDVITAVVLHPNTSATEQELRQFATTHLAPFKIPSQVIFVKAIPVGPTGKPQRLYLAEQFGLVGSSQDQTGFYRDSSTTPRTSLEEVLAGLWATVLGLERIGIYDNFFQLGGDSILATQLLARIRDMMHVELSFHNFFEAPTIVDVAGYIEAAQQTIPQLPEPSLHSVPRDGPITLSYGQHRLWFLDQLGLSRHAYNLLEAIRLRGSLPVEALEQGFHEVIQRHEVLHTTFTNIAGQPYQVVAPITHVPLSVMDLRQLSLYEREAQVRGLAQAEVQRPFDLAQGPLLRTTLVRLTDVEHVLLLTMHHIVSDGWSHEVFWRELAVFYESFTTGQPLSLPALPLQYADFAHWQQQWLQGQVLDTQLAYWQQQLAGMAGLQLPTDLPRPAVQTFRGARHFLHVTPTLTQALKRSSQRHGVTLFMTLLAAFQTLLHRYSGQDDIVVGSLVANRNRVELEDLIGFFVNILVLRTDFSGDPRFQELLERVREVTLGAYEHQELPYEKLLEELRPPRDLSRNPLFQVLCVLHNTPQQVLELPGLTVQTLEIDPGTARFDITLEFWDTPEGLRGRFEYSTDLFEVATIARMAGHLQTLLAGVVAEPEQHLSRLPLLTADERQCMLAEWNATTVPHLDDPCIHRVFETQVRRTPNAVAVVCGDESFTYHELNRRANQVAHYLLRLGVRTETLVGLCFERSVVMVVGLLGILKAGAAYLPLDPTYPPERLGFMIEDAQPAVVLTQERLVTALPPHGAQMVCLDTSGSTIAQYRDTNPVSGISADHLAYVLYTSGSTGRPKGVLGLHRATLNALAWMWHAHPFSAHDVCCQKTSISFGDSIQELFGPLLRGMRLVLIPNETVKDFARFVQTLAQHRVTRLILVPSLLQALLDTYGNLQDRLPSLKLWFAGGEALPGDLCQRFQEQLPQSRLINLYGASEASDDTTWYDTSVATSYPSGVPIGRPIANTQVYVLDRHLQPVPIGVPGELYVGGGGLTRGYLKRPELTAEQFIPHPFSREPGVRLYKTGDIVRYRPDGTIEYIGRSDHQVKLRGIRIEPEEIEAVLRQHPTVRETAVVVREDMPAEPRLIAYVVPAQEPGPSLRELRHFLETQLPVAMVPATFVMLETLPLTPSGKVNRRVLPDPGLLKPALEERYVAPRSPMEQQVASIWCDILGLERVGLHDNFFELGGHSLLAMRLLFRVCDATQIEMAVFSFFETPTVIGMVTLIETAKRTEQALLTPAIVPIIRGGPLPAAIAQEHFWLFDQILPGLPLFNIPYVIRLLGMLNIAALENSFNEIIRRHESLRTTFASVQEQLVQVVGPMLPTSLTVADLRALPESEREDEAQRLRQEESQHPFDLVQGPLLRASLLQLSQYEHLLLVTLHHIICDGWSLGVFMRELGILYDAFVTGASSPLATLPIQYADFAAWQRQWQHDAVMQAQLAYWQGRLHDVSPRLELPMGRPRETTLPLHTARHPFELSMTLFEALKRLSQQEGCTLFMTCLTAFNVLLYGYTGQKDLRIATLVANRTRRETEGLIGLLVNTVLLSTDLGGNPTLREVLQRSRATVLGAYAHQDLPFEELVRTIEQEHDRQRRSLCQVMIIWHNAIIPPHQDLARLIRFEAIEQSMMVPNGVLTTFDLIFMLRERPQGLIGTLVYKSDLFDATTINRILDDFRYVLACLSTQPEQAVATFCSLQDGHD